MADNKKLTGWLILLIAILTVGSLGRGGRLLTEIPQSYRPYFAQYPSLPTAVTVFQWILGASICSALYTAWLLYCRNPGTLPIAQKGFLITAALRIAAGWSIPALGGLPSDVVRELWPKQLLETVVAVGFAVAWYLYLTRSRRVGEIYAPLAEWS
jgi:hypothetical protein